MEGREVEPLSITMIVRQVTILNWVKKIGSSLLLKGYGKPKKKKRVLRRKERQLFPEHIPWFEHRVHVCLLCALTSTAGPSGDIDPGHR